MDTLLVEQEEGTRPPGLKEEAGAQCQLTIPTDLGNTTNVSKKMASFRMDHILSASSQDEHVTSSVPQASDKDLDTITSQQQQQQQSVADLSTGE